MRILYCCLLVLAIPVSSSTPGLAINTVSTSQLQESESRKYLRIKSFPGVERVKVISINEDVLLTKETIRLELFEDTYSDFKVSMNANDGLWVGKGKNLDRFLLRKSGGKYTGHILVHGRQYVVMSIKPGISVLYEQRDDDVKCGTDTSLGLK